MVKYCIFDLDGTLLNTLPTILYYLNETLTSFGYPPATEEQCKRYVGDGAKKLISRALADRGELDDGKIRQVLSEYDKAYNSSPLYLTQPYPGITGLIGELKRAGITVGVVSNKPDFAAASVVRAFFGDAFSFVTGAKDGAPLKPSPDIALALLGKMGGDPSECAFIGDTNVDIYTGKNMGAALTVGVLWGFRGESELRDAEADAIVTDPDEIRGLICECK